MNDLNKITEVDLNSELLAKINKRICNTANKTLTSTEWIAVTDDIEVNIPEDMDYAYYCPFHINSSSIVEFEVDEDSKQYADTYGLYKSVEVTDGAIVFFSKTLPTRDLNVTIFYSGGTGIKITTDEDGTLYLNVL